MFCKYLIFELHKLVVRLIGDVTLKKLLKIKNRIYQSANNHKIPSIHKMVVSNHTVSKGIQEIYKCLAPIYEDLDSGFSAIDLMDLEFYERWLNGRY